MRRLWKHIQLAGWRSRRFSWRPGWLWPGLVLGVSVLGLGIAGVFLGRRAFWSPALARWSLRRMDRVALRRIIHEAAARQGVSEMLVEAVIRRESDYRPLARGRAGEMGLMQITAGAVRDWERATGFHCANRGVLFDPRLNVEIGTWYLARALRRWRGYAGADILALAQYNAGPGNVGRWVARKGRGSGLESVRFSSTRKYIETVLDYRKQLEKR